MNLSFNIVAGICLGYVTVLFAIAWFAERRASRGQFGFLRSPLVYTLSISVYCTAWTYYGAVGSAARNGLEFITIYLGPTLVFVGWFWLLRRLVRIGRAQRVTSIADLLSLRYGKSNTVAVLVTLLAVFGATPYIALQLQSLTLSFNVFSEDGGGEADVAFLLAAGLALFTIIFGTRSIDANERHHGVVTAIAFEAIVKLVALLAVGVFVVWGVADGPIDIARRVDQLTEVQSTSAARWGTLFFLSAAAIVCLPRMFQVLVVENVDERHLAAASWAFPLYLFLISLFVAPIAVVGLGNLPAGSNPDLFVLTIPLAMQQDSLAALAFLGGFSAATSMVVVSSIALSTMVSNHIVMPLWLRAAQDNAPLSDDVRTVMIRSRRICIAAILALGYLYYRLTGGAGALASIGLIAFLGVAQVLPALLGGLFWRGSTRAGAIAGVTIGFAAWGYTLFLPSFGDGLIFGPAALQNGPFGVLWLRPQALFGVTIDDALVHAAFWSLGLNAAFFIGVSLLTFPKPIERLQAMQFANRGVATASRIHRTGATEDLLILAQRILGRNEGMRLFNQTARDQGKASGLPAPTDEFIARLEREFAGSVGAATAHAMISQATGEGSISVEDMIRVADETAEIMEYSAKLQAQSKELEIAAAELRTANRKLTELSAQKDAFLSQVSHELRTPMTSIRSFAEILGAAEGVEPERRARYSKIIHDESMRLTRLLDDILDLSFLENGRVQLNIETVRVADVIDRAVSATETLRREANVDIQRDPVAEAIEIETDFDRLAQVFINLIANAIKYGRTDAPEIAIRPRIAAGRLEIDVADNGPGISRSDAELIFEKFAKLSPEQSSGSAGLGLPISREIMRNLGGELSYVGRNEGAVFRIGLPLVQPLRAEAAE